MTSLSDFTFSLGVAFFAVAKLFGKIPRPFLKELDRSWVNYADTILHMMSKRFEIVTYLNKVRPLRSGSLTDVYHATAMVPSIPTSVNSDSMSTETTLLDPLNADEEAE